MQIIPGAETHDVVVVGSGAAGGMAAYNLVEKGHEVLLLDAGDYFERSRYWTHVTPYEWFERTRRGEEPYEFFLSRNEQPYTTPNGQEFDWTRVWGVGGKTNVWGRVSLRLSDLDLRAAEIDGWGIPWPIRYRDLAPYYDRVEQIVGICGGEDDSDVLPGSRYYMPPPPPRCGEVILGKSAESLGIPVVPIRRANFTQPHRGFPPCHFCGACGRGCDSASFFCTADHLIPQAQRTGRLQVVTNAVVTRVLVDDRGLANGVQYFERHGGKERRIRSKIVVLGASCLETTRILLNSRCERFPNGLGNSHDVLGRNYCEQVMAHVHGFLPQLFGQPSSNDAGIDGSHIYLPRFNHRIHRRDYLRGFGIQFWQTGCQPSGVPVASRVPGFGREFKEAVRLRYPALVSLHPFGEVLSRPENRAVLDENTQDRYGLPVLRIDVRFGENERRMLRHMYDTCEEILQVAGAEISPIDRTRHDPPGSAIHEHGTCRMGTDPRSSMLNSFSQLHEVRNVFVVDGSAFPAATEKNPTLTILALACRATDFLSDQIRQGNL